MKVSREYLEKLGFVAVSETIHAQVVFRHKETGQEITWDAISQKVVKGTLKEAENLEGK